MIMFRRNASVPYNAAYYLVCVVALSNLSFDVEKTLRICDMYKKILLAVLIIRFRYI